MTRSAIYAYAGDLWRSMAAEYNLALEAHINAAETACAGHLLSAHGAAAGTSIPALFRMNPTVAHAHASSELREFWADHPRPTLAAYEAAWLDAYLGGPA